MKVVKLQSPHERGTDPNTGIPVITAAITANPDVRLIAYPGGQPLANAKVYLEVAGNGPGETSSTSASTPARRSSTRSRRVGCR